MKILICDDNIYTAENLKDIVSQHFDNQKIEYEITVKNESTAVMNSSLNYDIAFLDIEMPVYNGLDIAKELQNRNENTIIFIVTSHQYFLDDALNLRVFRFLPKPFDRERIIGGLDIALRQYIQNTNVVDVNDNEIVRIFTGDIIYITIKKRKTEVVTKTDKILSDKTIEEWKKLLADKCFAQTHYSFIVNLKYVMKIDNDDVILKRNNNESVKIKIAQRRYKAFKETFYRYMTENM